jgi:hypothetical protein
MFRSTTWTPGDTEQKETKKKSKAPSCLVILYSILQSTSQRNDCFSPKVGRHPALSLAWKIKRRQYTTSVSSVLVQCKFLKSKRTSFNPSDQPVSIRTDFIVLTGCADQIRITPSLIISSMRRSKSGWGTFVCQSCSACYWDVHYRRRIIFERIAYHRVVGRRCEDTQNDSISIRHVAVWTLHPTFLRFESIRHDYSNQWALSTMHALAITLDNTSKKRMRFIFNAMRFQSSAILSSREEKLAPKTKCRECLILAR